ncbi:MAG: DEAD/DEAH box helicase family protein [Epsilonproteobacteria bacterium]|nr:DEAD/DEAH box helicase family protein [Campylobacterota bacterium]
MSQHKEEVFENEVTELLKANGYIEGTSKSYDKTLALYSDDLIAYIKRTSPKAYEKLSKMNGENVDSAICGRVAKLLDTHGALHFLRNEVKDRGAKFKLCQFRPELENEETQVKYEANILRVVRQLYYSENNTKSIDLVLFLNGIPIVTIELKTDFTQAVEVAKSQYKTDRLPKGEPLLEFKKRALVHFAVSGDEAWMTTKLAGAKTFFLPFNKGTKDGGAGNPVNENGYATQYLWDEVLSRDSILNILHRYMHLQVEEVEDHRGKKSKKETMIFPRYHQLDATRKLLEESKKHGAGQHYLVQHSAGSGKSNSIAWLAHQLSSLHGAKGEAVFDSVIVITDRTVLDEQLQETISGFDHTEGVVVSISCKKSQDSKSTQLTDALERGAKIIISTIQTFPFVLKAIRERTSLKENSYAIIADEAHSSQTGGTAKKLREVLNAGELEENEELSVEEMITASLEARTANKNLSYYAFTATPKPKTLELFGILEDPSRAASKENRPKAFHEYTMRQAIEEGFILDMLRGYTTYKLYYKLEHANLKRDSEVESKRAKVQIAKWMTLHPHNISQKIEIICEHFTTHVAHLLDGQAKAMVVTSSRESAVSYKLAFDNYIKEQNLEKKMRVMVAFSGKVEHDGKEYSENQMNPELHGRDMRKAFNTPDYQVMLVANKFQTGFDQPKLVAMYVDKKLGGVDCVQTLSRLNRTYAGKEQTFVLDFYNEAQEIQEAFEPYYKTTEIEDVTDPNLVYELELKLQSNNIFSSQDVENFALAFFLPEASQAKMTSAMKPAVDRYKVRYQRCLEEISQHEEAVDIANREGDEKGEHNYRLALKELHESKSELDIFKKDLVTFVRMYEFLSQIVDYDDEELEKLWAFVKHLIPNLKSYVTKEPIDISMVELTHYKLHRQKEASIALSVEDAVLQTGNPGGAVAREPEKELLSYVVEEMNTLFKGDFSADDMLNYARTLKDKMAENQKVVEQVKNNTQEQAMMGGFVESMNDAIVESMETHQNLATEVLSEEKVLNGLAKVLYKMLKEGMNPAYVVNNSYGLGMVAEANGLYGKD